MWVARLNLLFGSGNNSENNNNVVNGGGRKSYRKENPVIVPINNLLIDLSAPSNLNYF